MKINYFNFKEFENEYLLTNEMGFYCFVDVQEFHSLVKEDFSKLREEKLIELKEKMFLYNENDDVFIERVKEFYRNNKMYLFESTCLHIFVMTNACNMCCVYCQAQDSEQLIKGIMNKETALKAVEVALQSPNRYLTFEFQGGEPLTNFEVIKEIVEYTELRKNDKEISYTIVTNTLLLTEEMMDFFKKYRFAVSTSLDGGEKLHNANRPRILGGGTYRDVVENIKKMQEKGIGVGAIQTTTRDSLVCADDIVETYRNCDLHYLFLRPLTPLGYAKEHWEEIGYTSDEFLLFYKKALDKIIQYNVEGYKIKEGHASIFLRKIICQESDNYMELRSPCGAGVGQMAYYYDGKVYTCDEGRMLFEMGLSDFCLGDVSMTYDEMMESDVCKVTCQSSVLEGLPQCCDCVYHPYCGVCPVVNYAMENNIYSREANGYKCRIYKGIIDILFGYIHNDNQALEIFKTWV